MTQVPVIAVVGVGFAGAATAVGLLRGLAPGSRGELHLIERRAELGRGVAYGTRDPLHRLNVPAREMSLLVDDPAHLLRWLAAEGHPFGGDDHLPRGLYGDYVAATLAAAVAGAPAGWQVVVHRDEALACLPEAGGYALRLASGATLHAAAVVLAWGPMPPAPHAWGLPAGQAPPWLVSDPWSPAALAPLAPGSRVLLVGTGLTAVDVALSLLTRGASEAWLVSRRGRLPPAGSVGQPHPRWWVPGEVAPRASRVWRRVREEVRRAEAAGGDWRDVLAALRPDTPAIWQALPLVERRRFLRHGRALWDAHRHQLPPETARATAAAVEAGQLHVRAGRILKLDPSPEGGVTVRWRTGAGSEASLGVARVVVCTGPEGNYRRTRAPLAQALVGAGLARPDALRLGLDVGPDGGLLDEDGGPTPRLWGVGALRRGLSWEASAVRELRAQAAEVASAVRASLGL